MNSAFGDFLTVHVIGLPSKQSIIGDKYTFPSFNANSVISVNEACDIAKENADIILLKSDLNVLMKGIIEGRMTHFNMMEYIKITTSSNFGNMLSLIFASIFLPFLPMEPEHILILNLIYDMICTILSFDNVDNELLYKPIDFNVKSTFRFILIFGPISSIFDIITFIMLYYVLIPNQLGFSYLKALNINEINNFKMVFQTGWFIFFFNYSSISHSFFKKL